MNKCELTLTKEELVVLLEGVELQESCGSAVFEEYDVNKEDLIKKLKVKIKDLEWREDNE